MHPVAPGSVSLVDGRDLDGDEVALWLRFTRSRASGGIFPAVRSLLRPASQPKRTPADSSVPMFRGDVLALRMGLAAWGFGHVWFLSAGIEPRPGGGINRN